MDQQNQSNTPDGSGDVPMKRKRGRPRKYPRPDSEESSYGVLSQSKRLNAARVEQAPVPPRYGGVNENQHLQRPQENDPNEAIIGQVVSGVIEAVFDAGYLLSVRVGDSDTALRGLVFKPGRYVPVSPENDVAPGVPMIQRNEVPFPSRTTQFQTPPPKEKTVVTSGSNIPSAAVLTTDQLARGNVAPVLLTPSSFSQFTAISSQPSQVTPISSQPSQVTPISSQPSQVTPISSQPSQVTPISSQPSQVTPISSQPSQGTPIASQPSQVTPIASQPSQVTPIASQPSQVTPASIGSGVIVSKEIPVDGNQALTYNAKTSQITLPSGVQSEGVSQNQPSSDVLNGNDPKPLDVPSGPFKQLVTEAIKRIETPLEAMDTGTGNRKVDDNILVKDPSTMQEDKIKDIDQAVLIKPLQAVESHTQEDSASVPKASDHPEIGKMTELLQVLQNEKTENPDPE